MEPIYNPTTLRLGTRRSALAQWQTRRVCALLKATWPHLQIETEIYSTRGDEILDTPLPMVGGKGLFTAELEEAMRTGAIHAAVHSLKDMPTEPSPALAIGAVTRRVNPADVLVSRDGYTLKTLPEGARVGTSSPRRAAQLWHYRPDVHTLDIRGNINTRLEKAMDPDGPYDAILLAYAGLARLDLLDDAFQVLPLDVMMPAPGQGALGVQCRDEPSIHALIAAIADSETTVCVAAERAFLAGLGGGCSVPIAAYAQVEDGTLTLAGRVAAPDGSSLIALHASAACPAMQAETGRTLGAHLAREALAQGAAELLEVAV